MKISPEIRPNSNVNYYFDTKKLKAKASMSLNDAGINWRFEWNKFISTIESLQATNLRVVND